MSQNCDFLKTTDHANDFLNLLLKYRDHAALWVGNYMIKSWQSIR